MVLESCNNGNGRDRNTELTHRVDPNILYVMCRGGMQCVVIENVLYVLNRKRAKANESEFEKIMNRIIFLKKKKKLKRVPQT